MKRENLKKLLLHKYPKQEEEIEALVVTLPENVEDAHVHMNYFRDRDPSLIVHGNFFNTKIRGRG